MRLLALFLLTSFVGCAQPSDIRSAFQEVRRGNYNPVAKLKVTAADAPVIAEFVRDSDENVAREAVTVLEKLGGPAACAALALPSHF